MIYDSICLAIAIGSVIFTAWHCGVFFIGSFPSDQRLEKNATFLDTGEPVEKKVAQ